MSYSISCSANLSAFSAEMQEAISAEIVEGILYDVADQQGHGGLLRFRDRYSNGDVHKGGYFRHMPKNSKSKAKWRRIGKAARQAAN